MKTYKLTIVNREVTEFNEQHQDWSGKTWAVDTGNSFYTNFEAEKLTAESIVKVVNDYLGAQLEAGDLLFENGQYGEFAIIENLDGIPDKKGKFLVDYAFTIEPTAIPLNLENLFNRVG